MPFDLIGATPAYFKFGDNSPTDIFPVYISNHGLPWTGFLVRQDLGATPGNPQTIEMPEFRYIKITESGQPADHSYAPYSELGDSCLFK